MATPLLLGRVCDKRRETEYRSILKNLGLDHDGTNLAAAREKIRKYCREQRARRNAAHGTFPVSAIIEPVMHPCLER